MSAKCSPAAVGGCGVLFMGRTSFPLKARPLSVRTRPGRSMARIWHAWRCCRRGERIRGLSGPVANGATVTVETHLLIERHRVVEESVHDLRVTFGRLVGVPAVPDRGGPGHQRSQLLIEDEPAVHIASINGVVHGWTDAGEAELPPGPYRWVPSFPSNERSATQDEGARPRLPGGRLSFVLTFGHPP